MVGYFSSPNKRGKARAAEHLRVAKNPRKRKERFGCGMQFSEGHSRIFLLEGGWWLSRIFFLKLFCLILKDSAFALSQSEPDKSARGQSHLGAGGKTTFLRSLPDPSLPSTAARRPQVMGRACGAYPSRTSLRRASLLKLTALYQPYAPPPRCCLPPQRRKKKK